MEGNDKVAVIGMSCNFPGAYNIDMLWENLLQGKESVRQLTEEELKTAGVKEEHLNNPNYIRAAASLDGYAAFDAAFFGYSAMEAKMMDPQQRKLLEQAYLAVEDAGYDYSQIEARVGIYTGTAFNGYVYHTLLANRMDKEYLPILIANDKDFASTRISYKLNLTGPSYNIQTACSTGLSALHLACQSIQDGEIDMALVGTSAVKYPHNTGYFNMGTDSKDGHVRTFDENASGTVFGSGVACMVIKRYEDAVADGDHIYATVMGSAVNNDGARKAGYTGPGVDSQAEVIVEAIANADITADKLSYVEAHGSGTPLGDSVELSALSKAFGMFTESKQFCVIGSIKPNIGHADVSAGMSGLIKTVLSLSHKQFVPSINCEHINKHLELENTPFYVNRQQKKWESKAPRRAGVFATAIGGTNAFVVLEENLHKKKSVQTEDAKLYILSAKSREALESMADALLKKLEDTPNMNMDDVAYTLQTGRAKYNHCLYFVCESQEEVVEKLKKREVVYGDRRCFEERETMEFVYGEILTIADAKAMYQYSGSYQEAFDICRQKVKELYQIDLWSPVNSRLYKRLLSFSAAYALGLLLQRIGLNPARYLIKSGSYPIIIDCLMDKITLEEAFRQAVTQPESNERTDVKHYHTKEFAKGLMTLVGESWLKGIEIQWNKVDQRRLRNRVSLPGYCFQGKQYVISEHFVMDKSERNG